MTNQASLINPALPKSTGDHIRWGQLAGSSNSVAIANLAKQQKSPVVLICKHTPSAIRFTHELEALLSDSKVSAHYFPDWETLPYDTFSPHQDIISQRLHTLFQLQQNKAGVYVIAASTASMLMAPKSFLSQHTLLVNTGDQLDMHTMRQQLEKGGYRSVDQVMEHGEFSARGSILDLFPMGSKTPFRIDFFDDEVDSIRPFDPDTQRSSDEIKAINLLPAHEFPIDENGIELFRKNWRECFPISNDKDSIYYQVSKQIIPAGIEYYLPLFFEQTATLFDYLPDSAIMLFDSELEAGLDHFLEEVGNRYENRRVNPLRPLLEPTQLFLKKDQFFGLLKQYGRIELCDGELENKAGRFNFATEQLGDISIKSQLKKPHKDIAKFIDNHSDVRVLFIAETQGRRETLLELLEKGDIKPKTVASLDGFFKGKAQLAITVLDIEHSFIAQIDAETVAVICETELLGNPVSQRRRRRKGSNEATTAESIVKNLAELSVGMPVVHYEHGIGRYQGLMTMDAGGMPTEFLMLEYADSKLYVPVASLHLISRYSGADQENAPIHKLSSDAWDRAKRKAAEKVRDVAAELLDVYAKRAAKPGFEFRPSEQDYAQFCAGFPFEETPDQLDAITNVYKDMRAPQAMDRLVCGDVGFGKTEVAMRAAFIAISEGKQVSVLVPTTLLAQQHYENFRDRFADWPIKVEVLSRFKTAKEQKQALEELAEGKVDIIIGTHKLLSSKIEYRDLGLLVVDEEHRFGVRQKEQIKKFRADVDILTLTATPIPRTLNMAMSGMRDLSIIATPPARRLAVKTFVRQRDEALIKEAISREIMRGGQVYFLHNSVETIERTAEELQALVPEARITVGHGQMRERELERIMSDFYHQRFNVLVCTTIVETGIDVPTANTIIIDRADKFGLAQLHQLRGRVGRSHHQAYAYLMTPHEKRMTKDALKRLEAIASLEDLGAGFALATHDLEIRGAGELLGEGQSGQITSIGFTLYMEMLEEAVNALKEGREPALTDVLNKQTEIELRIPALLPETYINDISLRLSLYKKVASCKTQRDIDDAKIELIDRFGSLPDATKNLLKVNELRLLASKLGINKIEAGREHGVVEFDQKTKVKPDTIIGLIQADPKSFGFAGPDKLKFSLDTEQASDKLKRVANLLNALAA